MTTTETMTAAEIADRMMANYFITAEKEGRSVTIMVNEDGDVYAWLNPGDEGDPAISGLFGTPEEDDREEWVEVGEQIRGWLAQPFTTKERERVAVVEARQAQREAAR
jgi:hypothetical protein